MEKQEIISTTSSSLPILPRLNRVERLVHFLEERHNKNINYNWHNWERCSKNNKVQMQSMSSAMEEVHYKGTLIDRLSALENRVLQLWVDLEEMDEDGRSNTTTSGSSGSATNSTLSLLHRHPLHQSTCVKGKGNRTRHKNIRHFRKWLTWFPMGC